MRAGFDSARIFSSVYTPFSADSAPACQQPRPAGTTGYIFFYGTLMRGFELRRRLAIDALLQYVGRGTARGALFDLGPYPAVIRAAGTVRGEVYAVTDPAALLPRVDAVECYLPGDPARSEYIRMPAPVAVDGAAERTAWIYCYARPLGAAAWIPSGDYREYIARTRRRPSADGAGNHFGIIHGFGR